MTSLNYYGDLKNDIKNSNSPFNRKKEILERIISFIMGIPIVFLLNVFIGLDKESIKSQILYWTSIYAVVNSSWQYFVYRGNKNKTIKAYEKANKNLDYLVGDLGLKNIMTIDKEDLQRAIVIEEKDEFLEETEETKKSSKTVTRQFYFLDREEKIRALKSIRKVLKEGRKVTSDETSLYYSEEDLDYLRLPVRIVKKLEKK